MKYYIGTLEIRCGEFEFNSLTLKFQIEDNIITPEKYLVQCARTYYEGEPDHDGMEDSFFFHDGMICVEPGRWLEINKQTFDVLTLITEM